MTERPLLWDDWLRAQWGLELHEELRQLALFGANPDMTETLARLQQRWAQIEGRAA